jgi:hypothetical protein
VKRLGDALQGMLALAIGTETRKREQPRSRTSENHLTWPFLVDLLADELLREFQGHEDIGLKGPADEIDRKLTEWAVFADPCVAEKDVNVLGHCGSTYAHKMMTIEA